jgi:hypothetical protein
VVTDGSGRADFSEVPEGVYHANVWHPRLRIDRQPSQQIVTVRATGAKLAFSIALSAGAMPGMGRMHKSDY